MEDFAIFILLGISHLAAYKVAHDHVWFQINNLFDILPATAATAATPQDQQFFQVIQDTSIEDRFLYRFYSKYSFSSKYVHKCVRALFSLVLSLSVVVVEIVLWKIKTYDDVEKTDSVIAVVWPVVIASLSFSLILLVPYLSALMIFNKFYTDRLSTDALLVSTAAFILVWLLGLRAVSIGPFFYTESLLTKLALLGITIMAILSGIASISTPHHVLVSVWKRRQGFYDNSASIFPRASKGFSSTVDINSEMIKEYEKNIEENLAILKKFKELPSNGSDVFLKQQLIEKIAWYKIELDKLKLVTGKPRSVKILYNAFQLTFFLFCIFKLIVVFGINLPKQISYRILSPKDIHFENFGKENEADPLAVSLANILDIVLFTFDHQQELDSLSKLISLIFSLSMFACSLSTVLSTISRLLSILPLKFQLFALSVIALDQKNSKLPVSTKDNQTSMNEAEPSIIKNLIFVELVGVYILATILLIRSNLPYDVSEKLNSFLGSKFTVPSVNIDIWFDEIFALSAVLTLIGFVVTSIKPFELSSAPGSFKRRTSR